MSVVGYTTTEELARLLKIDATTYATQLTEVPEEHWKQRSRRS